MRHRDAATAAIRLGLGARPGEIEAIGTDPAGWAADQLTPERHLPEVYAGFASTAARVDEAMAARAGGKEARQALQKELRTRFHTEARLRAAYRAGSDRPVAERLVAFWSNHFAVSVQKGAVLPFAIGLERDAIRPRAVGRFEDVLVAVVKHPAMLMYLDQPQSVGPRSRAGTRTGKGLNENLAREILELHTLGVDGGYAQSDVEAFARVLTGFALGSTEERGVDGFRFAPNRHEPGNKTILGKDYREDGEQEALAVLHDLAGHPSTARHMCGKLARHFVRDEPSEKLIAAMSKAWLDSDGDVARVLGVMLDADETWATDARKLKSPDDLVTSAARAIGVRGDGAPLIASLQRLGQVPFNAPSPAGWPDVAAAWAGPGAVLDRVEWAETAGERVGPRVADPVALAEHALGDRLRPATRAAMQAADPARAVALMIAAPEFQWR